MEISFGGLCPSQHSPALSYLLQCLLCPRTSMGALPFMVPQNWPLFSGTLPCTQCLPKSPMSAVCLSPFSESDPPEPVPCPLHVGQSQGQHPAESSCAHGHCSPCLRKHLGIHASLPVQLGYSYFEEHGHVSCLGGLWPEYLWDSCVNRWSMPD